ncbi:glycine zipper family protein [Desulforhopalus singaporensis]|uniref:YMGG-like Gly-zipper domain-containing protein n=1 Tax=Desulforhopalus singaporensis TaxID=91360 RepID=A0A1H0QMP6_9BACT|nr:glycine zipper family protein [Desulforhopalus singaporensis]SDP18542.1 hypothetical protein SAMN05660330_02036 [Desulforhopalus singaporensis]
MKTAISFFAAFIIALVLTCQAQARNNTANGLIIGGGTGALVGQAIGGNTESTLIGATLGSVVGVIVANNHDRRHRPPIVHHPQRPVPRYYQKRYVPHYRIHQHCITRKPVRYYHDSGHDRSFHRYGYDQRYRKNHNRW